MHDLRLGQIESAIGSPAQRVRTLFPDLTHLLVAALQQRNSDRMGRVHAGAARHGTIAFLRDLLALSVADPTCARMVLTAASVARADGHDAAAVQRAMCVRFHAVVQRSLVRDIEDAREPDTMDPANGAEQLLASYEGLQFQRLFRPHLDRLTAYDRATTRLRHG